MATTEDRDQELIDRAKSSGIILSYQDDDTTENSEEPKLAEKKTEVSKQIQEKNEPVKDESTEDDKPADYNQESEKAQEIVKENKPEQESNAEKEQESAEIKADINALKDINLDDGNCEQIVKIVDDSQKLTRFKTIKGNEGLAVLPKLKYLVLRKEQDNYELVTKLPTDLLFKQDNGKIAELHFAHKTEQVTRTKTVNETVEYATSDDSKAPDKVTQQLTFTQKGVKDLVTGLATWEHKDLVQYFDEVKTPEIAGYSSDPSVINPIKITVNNDNFNDSLDVLKLVNYLPERQTIIVKFVDAISDKEIDEPKKLTGFTNRKPHFNGDQLVKYYEGKGYKLDNYPDELQYLKFTPKEQEYTITFKHQLLDVTLDNPLNPKTGTDLHNKLTKKVTRTIVFKGKNLKHDSVKQNAVFTRTAKFDAITSEVTYEPYTAAEAWAEYTAPDIAGYKAVTPQISAQKVTADSDDVTVELNYEPLALSIDFIFYDEDEKKKLYSTSETGNTYDECNFDFKPFVDKILERNYNLLDNPIDNKKIIFDPKDQNQHYVIKFGHKTKIINLDNPVNVVTKENEAENLKSTVTRFIKFSGPYGIHDLPKDVMQTAAFERDGVLDLVTGKIQYNKYLDTKTKKERVVFEAVNIPTIKGYSADTGDLVYDGANVNGNKIDSTIVTGETDNIEVDVNYEAQFQHISFTFFDKRESKVLGKEDFAGKTATPIDFNLKELVDVIESKGYKADPYHFKLTKYPDEDKRFRLNFDHQFKDINSANPDKGIILEKSYDYTILFVDKNKTPIQDKFVFKQKLTRKATKDLATGKILYTDWMKVNTLPKQIKLTPINGLIPRTPKLDIPDLLAAKRNLSYYITYLAPLQTIKVDYINDGNIVKTFNLDFKLKQNVAVKLEELTNRVIRMGYTPAPNEPTDNELAIPHILKYDEDLPDTRHYKIPVKEEYDQSIETKHAKRNIIITNPDKSKRVITEDAMLTRLVQIGKASGKHKYSPWSKNIWDTFAPQPIRGYVPSTTHVPETIVDGNTIDSNIKIDYTKIPEPISDKSENEEIEPKQSRETEEKPKLGFLNWLKTKFSHKNSEKLIPDALPEPEHRRQSIHVKTKSQDDE